MKSIFLYLNLFIMSFIAGLSVQSFAEKKYRYIKREHGAHFLGDISGPLGAQGATNISGSFSGSYSYNWKGFVEIGPYFGLGLGIVPFNFSNFQAGLKGEYNIIKNRGRRKFIPAVGLSAGVAGDNSSGAMAMQLSVGVHGVLKAFVAKRTAFVTHLGYNLQTPFQGMFSLMTHNLDIKMGFAYYFDFY